MRLGYRSYVLMAVGVLAAAPVVVLGIVEAERWSDAARTDVDVEVRARAGTLSRELEQLVDVEARAVERLADHVALLGDADPTTLQQICALHRGRSRYLAHMYVADRAAISIAADPAVGPDGRSNAGIDYSDRDYYRAMLRTGDTAVSRVQLGRRSGTPNIQIAAPVRDETGTIVGFAEGSVDLGAIERAVDDIAGRSTGLRIVVTDGESRVIADSARRLPVLQGATADLYMRAAAATTRSAEDEAGRERYAAVAPISARRIGWNVVVSRDRADIEARATAARRQAMTAAGITAFVALGLVALWAAWSSRPLSALAEAATAVGEGDFSRAPPEPRRFESREMSQLLIAVKAMIGRRRAHNADRAALIDELERANSKLRWLAMSLERANDAVEIANVHGVFEYVNPAFERLTGYSFDEAVGNRPRDLLRSDRADPAVLDEAWRTISGGNPWRGSYPGRRKDGTEYYVAVSAAPIVDEAGTITHYVAVKRDITEERKAEEVLRLKNRMASVGTLAAGVAHEINNPLTYVSGNLTYLADLLRSAPRTDETTEALDACAEASMGVGRVTEIVKGLHSLSRADEDTVVAIDVHELLDQCIRMANTEIRHRAVLERDFGATGKVAGNEARLGQVFINLLVNAAQALDVGHHDSNRIIVRTRTTDDGKVEVAISDTGAGIEPEALERIFDPFFTTKPIGEGTGLGLSLCHSIVQQLDGQITVVSAVGAGTTFTVALPAQPAAAEPGVAEARARSKPSRAHVLVVDDEPLVCKSLRRALSNYEVTVLSNPRDALEAIALEQYDVVLCDVMMPDMTGLELFERARDTCPATADRFVFMSGGVFSPAMQRCLEELPTALLEKPISRDRVNEVIERMCQRAGR